MSARPYRSPLSVSAVFLVILFVGYFALQANDVLFGPSLVVDSPSDGEVIHGAVMIRGHTDPNMRVSINGYFIQSDDDGLFEEQLPLERGFHQLKVVTKNRFGKETRINRSIVVK